MRCTGKGKRVYIDMVDPNLTISSEGGVSCSDRAPLTDEVLVVLPLQQWFFQVCVSGMDNLLRPEVS
jgi:hypothetical protein